jgi:hypothetical protein
LLAASGTSDNSIVKLPVDKLTGRPLTITTVPGINPAPLAMTLKLLLTVLNNGVNAAQAVAPLKGTGTGGSVILTLELSAGIVFTFI